MSAPTADLPDGAWRTDLAGDDLLRCVLAAVLRALPEPWPSDAVEGAVIRVLWPFVLASRLGADARRELRRLAGADWERPVEAIGDWPRWTRLLRLAVSHRLLHIGEDGLWSPGSDVADAHDDALAARAAFVIARICLESRDDRDRLRGPGRSPQSRSYPHSKADLRRRILAEWPYRLTGGAEDREVRGLDLACSLLWMLDAMDSDCLGMAAESVAGRSRWMGWVYAMAEHGLRVITQREVHELSRLDAGRW